jgi:hypothetical protein
MCTMQPDSDLRPLTDAELAEVNGGVQWVGLFSTYGRLMFGASGALIPEAGVLTGHLEGR